MMSTLANSFVLGTLSVLASGYIIHDAPILRWWLSRSTGYVLYFRTIATGLFLVFFLTAVLYMPAPDYFLLFDFTLKPEHAPILSFPVALFVRALSIGYVGLHGKCNPVWKDGLNLKILNEKGLDQFIYEQVKSDTMIMVTLENRKVYAGWPVEAPNNEDSQWLRLAPQWSGYRSPKSEITVQVDYSNVLGALPSKQNRMLIPVDKIVTVQPFDEEIFQKFNPQS